MEIKIKESPQTMQQQNASGGSTSDAQASVDEKQRAIESNETNENNEEA